MAYRLRRCRHSVLSRNRIPVLLLKTMIRLKKFAYRFAHSTDNDNDLSVDASSTIQGRVPANVWARTDSRASSRWGAQLRKGATTVSSASPNLSASNTISASGIRMAMGCGCRRSISSAKARAEAWPSPRNCGMAERIESAPPERAVTPQHVVLCGAGNLVAQHLVVYQSEQHGIPFLRMIC